MTLSASIGTVTETGGGTWSWSFPTTDGPDEDQLVFVTATDAGGREDQVPFFLKVKRRGAVGVRQQSDERVSSSSLPIPSP